MYVYVSVPILAQLGLRAIGDSPYFHFASCVLAACSSPGCSVPIQSRRKSRAHSGDHGETCAHHEFKAPSGPPKPIYFAIDTKSPVHVMCWAAAPRSEQPQETGQRNDFKSLVNSIESIPSPCRAAALAVAPTTESSSTTSALSFLARDDSDNCNAPQTVVVSNSRPAPQTVVVSAPQTGWVSPSRRAPQTMCGVSCFD